jgi:transcriptional regulator with XRE-family HTH domain
MLKYADAFGSLAAPAFERVEWLSREFPDPKDQRQYAQERCIVAITEALGEALERANLNRAQLAEKLGVSKSHVSQLLGGRNLTLRTIGDVLWACKLEVQDLKIAPLGVAYVPSDHAAEWREVRPPEVVGSQPDLGTEAVPQHQYAVIPGLIEQLEAAFSGFAEEKAIWDEMRSSHPANDAFALAA